MQHPKFNSPCNGSVRVRIVDTGPQSDIEGLTGTIVGRSVAYNMPEWPDHYIILLDRPLNDPKSPSHNSWAIAITEACLIRIDNQIALNGPGFHYPSNEQHEPGEIYEDQHGQWYIWHSTRTAGPFESQDEAISERAKLLR